MRAFTVVSVAIGVALMASAVDAAEPQGGAPQTAARLRICFNDHDAPRADKASGKGYDLEIMRLVAQRLGRTLEPVWIQSDDDVTDIDATDLPLKRLARGECDAVASVPGEGAIKAMRGALALTRPYYGAGFELVGPETLSNDLAALKGRRLSVQSDSVANLMAVYLGAEWTAQTQAEDQLKALDTGKAEAALVWGPELGPLGRKPKAGFTPPVLLRWNEHVATRMRDEALRAGIDGALGELTAGGQVKAALAYYGVPARAPFETVFSRREMAAIEPGGR